MNAVSPRFPTPAPLWLALRLPQLALEVFPQRSAPAAVVLDERVWVADAAAQAAGIHPGMRLASAWGLVPDLSVQPRDAAAEARALDDLACWAGSLTPHVSLSPPDALLLEIGGCLRLAGGLPALLASALDGCTGCGFTPRPGIAPTPLAALWRARGACSEAWLRREDMPGALRDLPVDVMDLDADHAAALTAWGIRHIGELLALPRASLSNRLGAAFVLQLSRALGEIADPQAWFAFPEHFSQRLELPAAVDSAPALLFAARRLVAALSGWLKVRASGLRECRLVMTHARSPRHASTTSLPLRFASAVQAVPRIERVLREALERHTLVAPVLELRLEALQFEALPGEELPLFGDRQPRATVEEVIERLRIRLGEGRVGGLASRAAHRPELASVVVDRGAMQAAVPPAPRPAWLLSQPRALQEIAGRPYSNGPLVLVSASERIESGWWDEDEAGAIGDVRRDYYVACNPAGQWLWIYRDATGWWQHGVFA